MLDIDNLFLFNIPFEDFVVMTVASSFVASELAGEA